MSQSVKSQGDLDGLLYILTRCRLDRHKAQVDFSSPDLALALAQLPIAGIYGAERASGGNCDTVRSYLLSIVQVYLDNVLTTYQTDCDVWTRFRCVAIDCDLTCVIGRKDSAARVERRIHQNGQHR